MTDVDVRAAVVAERLEQAALLADLSPGQWDAPTLCGGWRRGRLELLQRPDLIDPLRVGDVPLEPGQPGDPGGEGARVQRPGSGRCGPVPVTPLDCSNMCSMILDATDSRQVTDRTCGRTGGGLAR